MMKQDRDWYRWVGPNRRRSKRMMTQAALRLGALVAAMALAAGLAVASTGGHAPPRRGHHHSAPAPSISAPVDARLLPVVSAITPNGPKALATPPGSVIQEPSGS